MDVLAPDVVLLDDGGGKVSVNLRPVVTADKVARLLLGIRAKSADADITVRGRCSSTAGPARWSTWTASWTPC